MGSHMKTHHPGLIIFLSFTFGLACSGESIFSEKNKKKEEIPSTDRTLISEDIKDANSSKQTKEDLSAHKIPENEFKKLLNPQRIKSMALISATSDGAKINLSSHVSSDGSIYFNVSDRDEYEAVLLEISSEELFRAEANEPSDHFKLEGKIIDRSPISENGEFNLVATIPEFQEKLIVIEFINVKKITGNKIHLEIRNKESYPFYFSPQKDPLQSWHSLSYQDLQNKKIGDYLRTLSKLTCPGINQQVIGQDLLEYCYQ
jgi:hypothetical protein